MELRRLRPTDPEKIDELWRRCHSNFGIPPRRFLVTDAVTYDGEGRISGYGLVRYFGEALLYLDKDRSAFEQAKSFKLLMEQAISDCKIHGLDQLNVFTDDDSFEGILKKYGFVGRDKGLFLELTNGK